MILKSINPPNTIANDYHQALADWQKKNGNSFCKFTFFCFLKVYFFLFFILVYPPNLFFFILPPPKSSGGGGVN
jgi:hypothetical protein